MYMKIRGSNNLTMSSARLYEDLGSMLDSVDDIRKALKNERAQSNYLQGPGLAGACWNDIVPSYKFYLLSDDEGVDTKNISRNEIYKLLKERFGHE